jgi:transposase, IS30 family
VSQAVGSRWFRDGGGMPPISLAPLSGRYLSFSEREEIAILHAQRAGVREIARRLNRSASTISRELRRNASTRTYRLEYRATTAQWHAERRASRPKVSKLAANDTLREYVQERLAGKIFRPDGEPVPGPDVRFVGRRHGRRQDRRWAKSWSPEQIANRLRIDFPDDDSMRISHEAIYQALYVQGRGALRRELVACLRTGRALRVPRARTQGRGKKSVTTEVMISERPAEANDRAVPGHWEGDLIQGLESSAIGTLVERTTRFTMLLHLPRMQGHGDQPREKNGPALTGHGAEAVRDAIAASITTASVDLAHRKMAMHRHGRAVQDVLDLNRVHQRLHEHEAESTLFLARLFALSGSVVADRDRDASVGERPFDINQVRGGLVRMLDCVCERLRRCQQHLEDLALTSAHVLQPRSGVFAQYGDELGARLQPKL